MTSDLKDSLNLGSLELKKQALHEKIDLLLANNTDKPLARVEAIYDVCLSAIEKFTSALKPIAPSSKEELKQKYQIKILGDKLLSYVLPEDCRPLDFVNDCAVLGKSVLGKRIVSDEAFELIESRPEFLFSQTVQTAKAFKGFAPSKNSSIGEINGAPYSVCDLTLAHLIYLILTGVDLFEGRDVRSGGNYLRYDFRHGLCIDEAQRRFTA